MSDQAPTRTDDAQAFNDLALRNDAQPVAEGASSLPPEPEADALPAEQDAAATPAAAARPAGYVAKCSMRGAGSTADPDDAPIERAFAVPATAGRSATLAKHTAPGVDVPHTPFDVGSLEPKRRKPRDKPIVAVITGDGKGKSTSGFGMLLRSWNRDYRCGVMQFVKSGKWKVGEQRAAEALGGIDWMKMGDGWSWISKDLETSEGLAVAGWEQVKQFIAEQRYEFLMLDEFTYPLKWGWIPVDEVVEVLANRPGFQHIVITGRDAPEALIDAADLVSNVTLVKHQMEQGIRGQQGIEW